MRIAVVGHRTYFENHYIEGWKRNPDVICLDVSESDYSWLIILQNWQPDVTLFYRPELYPARLLNLIPGCRIAFLTEPLPAVENGELLTTAESALRLKVYSGMAWRAYHHRIYYDAGRRATVEKLGWPIDVYRPLPLNTDWFQPPPSGAPRSIDVCFIGKATEHRINMLDFLRSSKLRFVWVAHGVSGQELARLFRKSRLVVNVHADGVAAQEPRLYLAASCACQLLTEPLSTYPPVFRRWINERPGPWVESDIRSILGHPMQWFRGDEQDREQLGVRRLIEQEYRRVGGLAVEQDTLSVLPR
jgi:hypothetical protein